MKELLQININKNNISNIFKVILILFLFITYNKLKDKIILEMLRYYNLDIEKHKEIINLGEGGFLELYNNYNRTIQIERKSRNIYKSDIMFLIIPGGAYERLMRHEQIPVAKKFYSLGYSSAILKYSIYPKHYPTNYNQGLKAIRILSLKYSKIILVGFSAGGHLAGILGTTEREKLFNTVGMILCYPVISFVNKYHEKSRYNFLGNINANKTIYHKLFSVENRVKNDTLPTFIWTLKYDKIVPYQNTLYMVEKLKKYNVKFEYIIFKEGRHGMGLADETAIRFGIKEFKNKEVAKWVKLSCDFMEKIIKNN